MSLLGATATLALIANGCVPDLVGLPCSIDTNCPTGQFCDRGMCSPGRGSALDGGATASDAGETGIDAGGSTNRDGGPIDGGEAADGGTPGGGGIIDGGGIDGGANPVDGGTVDAGTPCTFGTCGDGGACNLTTDRCEWKTCSGSAQEPSTCSYGQFCVSYDQANHLCSDVGGSCADPSVIWDPHTSSGPIVYSVERTTPDTTWCSGSTPADISILVSLYNAQSTFAAIGSAFPVRTLYFERSDGGYCDVANCDGSSMFRPGSGYTTSSDRKHLQMKLNLCGVPEAALTGRLHYSGGNEYCFTVNK